MNLQMAALVSGAATGFDTHLLLVLLILLGCGLLGGIGNYFLRDRDVDVRPQDVLRYPLLGVVAALTVPLVLSMLSSNLIEAGRTRATDYLVLAGFVLAWVVFSRRLFDNATLRLLGQADRLQKDLARLRTGLEQIQSQPARPPLAAVTAARPLPGESAEAPGAEPESPPLRDQLTHADVELLRVVADENIVIGNLADLADRSGVSREVAQQRLAILKSWGALDTRMNERQTLQWILSSKGRQMLADRLR